jgi:hypothetical protein
VHQQHAQHEECEQGQQDEAGGEEHGVGACGALDGNAAILLDWPAWTASTWLDWFILVARLACG